MAKPKSDPALRRARALRGAAASALSGRQDLSVVDVDCHGEDNYLFSYLSDATTIGIFVRTVTPEALGTAVHLRFLSARSCELEVEGEVLWVNAYRPSTPDNLHPGMGVRLVGVDDATRARLLTLVGRFAVLS
jgi:uncharacterized protein (TIGR02266 family)